jgi:hypothetical protein
MPSAYYALLKMNDRAMGIARIAGAKGYGTTGFAMAWGEIADCVYRQNGRALCDPNNRALAVEAATSLLREADLLAAPKRSDSSFAKTQEALDSSASVKRNLAQMRDMKDRVLTGLRARLQDGRLIAGDFGYFPAGDIKRLLQENKPDRNACAEEGMAG